MANDLFAPPSKEEMSLGTQASGDDLFAPPSKDELSIHLPTKPKTKSDKATVAIRNGLQGATLGFSDEVAGAVEAAGKMLGVEGAGGEFSGIKLSEDGPTLDWEILRDAYKKARDKERENLKKDSKDSPKLAATSNIVGSAISPVGKLKLLEGASALKSGAALGAAAGLGNSEADLTEGDAAGALRDTAGGAVLGGTIGKGVEVASPYVGAATKAVARKAGEGLAKIAETSAFKATGATLKDYRSKDVGRLGRYALDNGLKAFDSVDDIAKKFGSKAEEAGAHLDSVYDRAAEKFGDVVNKVGFDPKRDKSKIVEAARKELGDAVGAEAAVQKLSNYLDEVAARHGDLPNEQAKAAYQKAVEDYIPKFKNFVRDRREYRSAAGKAAEDLSQPILSGMSDDLQRTGSKIEKVEIQGKPASAAKPSAADYSEDTYLSALPQKQGDLFNPARGDDLLPMAQKMELDRMSSGEIASLGRQAEMEGLNLVPREYRSVPKTQVQQGQGQTKMLIEPAAPNRPLKPQEIRNPMNPRRTNDIKGAMDDQINYSRNPLSKDPVTEKAFRAGRRALSDEVDAAIESLGGDSLLQELKSANKAYGNAIEVSKMASDRLNRQNANKMFGLTDTIAGSAAGVYGLATGDWESAVKVMAAKKVAEKFGPAFIAKTADSVSKYLLRAPTMQNLARTNPKAFQATVIRLAERVAERAPLKRAAENDSTPSPRPLKGTEKWANDGFNKAIEAKPELQKFKGALLSDPKAKQILISMSDSKPGSKAFNAALSRLESQLGDKN